MALSVRNFARLADAVEIPDLVVMQREGYDRFLQSLLPPEKRKNIGLECFSARYFLSIAMTEV